MKHIIESNDLRVCLGSLLFFFETVLSCFKIGVVALVEEEWICTLSTIDYDELIYDPFVEVGKRLAVELKTVDVSLF